MRLGPKMLLQTHPDVQAFIRLEGAETDIFWSDSYEETLAIYWKYGPKVAVRKAVKEWFEVVKERVHEVFGPSSALPPLLVQQGMKSEELRKAIKSAYHLRFRIDNDIIEQLTATALLGRSADSDAPEIIVQGFIETAGRSWKRDLMRAIAIPWRRIVLQLNQNWNLAFEISPRTWEELVAAAFDEAGYDDVVLTPRTGDHGQDVIAVKKGMGTVRIIDSVKAHKRGHLVRYDDIKALMGVLQSDRASKGIVTTTSDFAPGIRKDPFISRLIPYRLELMSGNQLRQWLVSLTQRRP